MLALGTSLLALALLHGGCRPGPPAGATGAAQPSSREVPLGARLAAFAARASARPARTALLVGIQDYAAEGVPRLRGCRNDVAHVERLLVERFGFPPEDVFTLLDEEATHAGIVRAFHAILIARAGAGTEAVFYLSGHGSRVPDRSGSVEAERDGFDSTYVAYDSREAGWDGEHDLTDDELRSLVAGLCERTERATVITDSCHSGEVLRATAGGAKSVAAGSRPLDEAWTAGFWPAGLPLREDGPDATLDPARYVHLAAAQRDERAWELEVDGPGGTPLVQGAMTYFLSQLLESARPDTTWRELVADLSVRVATVKPQTVNHRGSLDRVLFGGDARPLPGFPAELRAGELHVQAGWLFGLREESLLEVRDGAGDVALGRARVTRATSTSARAVWEGPSPGPEPRGALRALELERGSGEPALGVSVEVQELVPWLRACDLVELVPLEAAQLRVFARGDLLFVETAEGLPVARPMERSHGDEALGAALLEALRAERRWRALDLLALERGALPLAASFRTVREAEIASLYRPAEVVEPDALRQGVSRVVGAYELSADEREAAAAAGQRPLRMVVLDLTNPHGIELYAYVLSLEEGRAVESVAPLPGQEPLLIPVAGERSIRVEVRARRDWPLARPMRDRYLVIATDRPVDFSLFRSRGALRGPADGSRRPPPLLARALEEGLVRGGPRASTAGAGWGITTVDLLVDQPPAGPPVAGPTTSAPRGAAR